MMLLNGYFNWKTVLKVSPGRRGARRVDNVVWSMLMHRWHILWSDNNVTNVLPAASGSWSLDLPAGKS